VTILIDTAAAFFTVIGFLATVFACWAAVALLLQSCRASHGGRPVPERPRLHLVVRDELAERRALRHERGIA
jgi:hypothetical protein